MKLDQKLEKIFTEFGLTKNDAKLYLTSLKVGPMTVTKLAKVAKLAATSAYQSFERLKMFGFFESEDKDFKNKVQAKDPDKVYASYFQRNANRLRRAQLAFKDLSPELKGFIDKGLLRPRVRYYEGQDAYTQILEESLEGDHKEVLVVADVKSIYKLVPESYDEKIYIPKRLEKKISFKALTPEGQKFIGRGSDQELLREFRSLPSGINPTLTVVLCGETVMFLMTSTEVFAVVIESQDLAQHYREIFHLWWETKGKL